jgi:hypothetical protein
MCREGWLVRSSAVEVEAEEHVCRESLKGVSTDDCRLPFLGRGEAPRRGPKSGG